MRKKSKILHLLHLGYLKGIENIRTIEGTLVGSKLQAGPPIRGSLNSRIAQFAVHFRFTKNLQFAVFTWSLNSRFGLFFLGYINRELRDQPVLDFPAFSIAEQLFCQLLFSKKLFLAG